MSQEKYSLRQVRENYQKSRKKDFEQSVVTEKYIYRPLSLLLTPIFLNCGFSANAVTAFRFAVGVAGAALLVNADLALTGFLLLFLAVVLDFVDGNIARITKSTTYYGKFLDSFVDNFVLILQFPIIAFGLKSGNREFFILLGMGATCLHLFTVFIEVQYERLKKEIFILDGVAASENLAAPSKTGPVYLVFNLIKNLDFSFLFPVMLIFIFCGAMQWYLALAFSVKALRFLAQLAKILIRGRKEIAVLRPSSRV